ncbi:MAG: hypothetical protein ACR2OZ_18160 [Verrucomicrobiales bacterium]
MKKAFEGYRRLARGLFSCSSVWLGSSHLLYVKGAGFLVPFTEEYLRFELKRIQALSIIRTRIGLVISLLLAASTFVNAALAWSAGWTASQTQHDGRLVYIFASVFFGLPSVLSLLALIVHFARGPTCLLQVQTRVRSERLRPLRRLRAARRVFDEISPLIAASQQAQARAANLDTEPGVPEPADFDREPTAALPPA